MVCIPLKKKKNDEQRNSLQEIRFHKLMTRTPMSARLLVLLLLLCTSGISPVAAAGHTVAPSGAEFIRIQDAIDWSSSGDTITVYSGTYAENIRLDKKISLIGIDRGSGAPVIDSGKKGNAVEILIDGCTVDGFVIRNSDLLNGIRITSDQNTIRNNTIQKNAQGITLLSAQKNMISGNIITGNLGTGIALEASNGNQVQDNIISANTRGISQDERSLSNQFFRNNFINTQNVLSKSTSSVWSTTDPLLYTYLGMKEESRMGNYWSDYHGRDANGDGIGDTPYVISSGVNPAIITAAHNIIDAFPLMDPKEYYKENILVPVKSFTPTPTPLIPITITMIPTARNTTTVVPAVPVVTPSPAPVVVNSNGMPPGTIALVLGFIVLVVLAGAIALVYRKQKARPPADSHAETSEHPTGKETVFSQSIVAPQPNPVRETTLPNENPNQEYYPPLSEQKCYFPRELENKYTDIAFVGRGGIAWVFSAIKKTDGMKVAVKIPISFDEMTGRSFLNEIKAWETLRHGNIVEVFGVNILPVPYVEMEFVPGSLEELKKPIAVWKAVHIIRGITDGLRYAHEQGFIHRDIKPHNILMTTDLVPKITDWGMSKVLAADVKKSSIAGFSLSYAAPEQVSPSEFGRTDERTDIYQLGVVFYEMVTGSIPFGGESIVEVGNAILRETPISPSEYTADVGAVEKIILKCLEKQPADRYQSAAELLDALSRYLDEDD
jgi:parallel beta-helix repeat protein